MMTVSAEGIVRMRDAYLRVLLRRAELMSMAMPLFFSAEMVRALPEDGKRYETVHGELLVTPAPRPLHQLLQHRLHLALGKYLEGQQVGLILASPADISWGPDSLVQPDLFVVQLDEARTLDWARMRTLLLAIEILSPSSVRSDRFTKRRLYQEAGVPLYWVVDADLQMVEVWTPDASFPVVENDQLTWQPAGVGAPFVLSLSDLFRPL
jgi:Uma2 family endonuclease